jgi:hypothetical protein
MGQRQLKTFQDFTDDLGPDKTRVFFNRQPREVNRVFQVSDESNNHYNIYGTPYVLDWLPLDKRNSLILFAPEGPRKRVRVLADLRIEKYTVVTPTHTVLHYSVNKWVTFQHQDYTFMELSLDEQRVYLSSFRMGEGGSLAVIDRASRRLITHGGITPKDTYYIEGPPDQLDESAIHEHVMDRVIDYSPHDDESIGDAVGVTYKAVRPRRKREDAAQKPGE